MNSVRTLVVSLLLLLVAGCVHSPAPAGSADTGGRPEVGDFDRMVEAARAGNGYVCDPHLDGSYTACACTVGAPAGTPYSCRGMEALCRRLGGSDRTCHTLPSGVTTCACTFPNAR